MTLKHWLVIFFLLCASTMLFAQDRLDVLEERLNQVAENYPGLNEKVELSMSGATIQEYIRAIGANNNINVNIDPGLDIKLSNNFKNVTAKDVFLFLCRRYDLDIIFSGPILTFTKFTPPLPPVVEKKIIPKRINVKYDVTGGLVSYDLSSDTLALVAKELTRLSGNNIIFSPELATKVVSGFMLDVPFETAVSKLAFANDMKFSVTEDGFYVLEKKLTNSAEVAPTNSAATIAEKAKALNVRVNDGLISLDAKGAPIIDIVTTISRELNKDFFLFSDLKGVSTVKIEDATYEEFLKMLFNGTENTFRKQGSTYLFGERNIEGLRQSKLITLKNRTIEKLIEAVPAELKKGLDIKVFEDLNGIIVSGSQPRINELEAFLREVDLVVPMVHIEVIIADVRKTNSLSAGISAGLGAKTATTGGTLLPDYNVTLNSSSINNLIKGLNGFGIINLGAVSQNFYISLKAMESNGVLKLRSTPQIATLNGHEAKLSIGETQYYLEVNNNLVNTTVAQQNLLQSQNWKAVNADLSLVIHPQVSGDEQVTMTINVKQSSFTERVSNTAPPGTINRDFQSLIRVKNGEMIMLGGLEESQNNNSGKGLPFLSRIPVLRWLFGERTKTVSQSKLTIFIKPTIIFG